MNKINRRYFAYILAFIAFGLYYLVYLILPTKPTDILGYAKLIPSVVTGLLIVIAIFSTWLWKCNIFHSWLVPFPNLNGTWKGTIHSTWVDPLTQKRPEPIPTILTIHQTFFKISCVMRTGEMNSYSFTSEFSINKETQEKLLIYSYNSKPKPTLRERSNEHSGTMMFEILEKPKRQLKGEYWTGRKTTGEIIVDFWKDDKLDNYPDSLGDHPVSQKRKS